MDDDDARDPEISTRQREFAQQMACTSWRVFRDGCACFYRVRAHRTTRWIVDADGMVLERAEFRTELSAARGA